ncbi:hypothetical protein FVEG_02769 [Fusarium verticillioides 7600]|uniref:Uncharacterized protein n=1 Tax=Gibberella moniliformis (strain M3125 / FGSC 7600) TaxID=334819 RepID=W7M5X1_GIBM7|nr:hypothetical protein FVEG_02769 [Fusarium verticillioides 7600]EWG40327.1 hypothetical protein FVEG_02769 [Fusarium verticillioides 7600]
MLRQKKRSGIFLRAGTERRRGPYNGSRVHGTSTETMKPYKPGVCKCLGHCPSRDFDLNIHLHITWSRLTTHTALTPPAPELIVSALQLGWPMSSLQLVSSSYPATFWYKASYVLNCLRVAAEYQVLGTSCACLLERQKYGPGISLLAGQTQFPSRSSTLVNGICSGGHNKYSSMLVSPLSHISLAYS